MQLLEYSEWLPGSCYTFSRVQLVVASTLVCGCQGVISGSQGIYMRVSRWLAGHGGWWLPRLCYGVVGGCQGVAMQFLRCCRLLPVCFYVVARVFICRC